MSSDQPIPKRFFERVEIEAMRFSTNNENGSPTMNAIVNWLNRGSKECRAWHNGTDIFVDSSRATVGDWVVRYADGGSDVLAPDEFEMTYEAIEGMDLSGVLEGARLGQAEVGS